MFCLYVCCVTQKRIGNREITHDGDEETFDLIIQRYAHRRDESSLLLLLLLLSLLSLMTTRVTPTTTPTNSIARLRTGFNGGRRCDHASRRRCCGGGEHLFLFPARVVTTFGRRSAQKQSSAFTRFAVLEKQKCHPS